MIRSVDSPLAADAWVCLMYHDVLPSTNAAGGGPERFAVERRSFERMLERITRAGSAGVSIADALAAPGRARVAISFDDGTRSQFDEAAPALVERGMTATFYVTTDWIGKPGYMTWGELRQLRDWGMSVQSHTRSHPFLSELDERGLRAELLESKAALDDGLGQDTTEIGLPGGDAPARRLRPLLAECGYRVVANSRWGVNRDGRSTPPLRVRRCTVRGDLTDEAMAAVIAGDRRLAMRRQPREALLAALRSTLGPTRYSRWRRRLLDTISG